MQPRFPTHDFHQTLVDFIAECKTYAKSSSFKLLEEDVTALMDNEINPYEGLRSVNPHKTAKSQFEELETAKQQVKDAEKKLTGLTEQQNTNRAELEEKQRQLVQAILLENSNNKTNDVNKMTSSNARFLQLTQQVNDAKIKIANINNKCFSCCCDYGKHALEVQQEDAQRELDELTQTPQQPYSTSTPQKSTNLITLEKKLDAVNAEIKKALLEQANPSSDAQDEAKATLHQARLTHEKLKMTIDKECYYYNAAVGRELMLYCIRVFERFMQLKTEAKGDLLMSANRYYLRLQAFMNLFWCTESKDMIASNVYQKFKALPILEQTEIFNTPLSKLLLNQLLPDEPGDTLDLLKDHDRRPPDISIPTVAPLARVTHQSLFEKAPDIISAVDDTLGLTMEHKG